MSLKLICHKDNREACTVGKSHSQLQYMEKNNNNLTYTYVSIVFPNTLDNLLLSCFYITSILVLFNNTVCRYINLTVFQVNGVVQFSLTVIYFIIALDFLQKSSFYKSVVVLLI